MVLLKSRQLEVNPTFLPHIQSKLSSGELDPKTIVTASMDSPSDVFKTLQKLLTPADEEVPF